MCIVIRGKKNDGSWLGHRSVEMLAFHKAERRVEILFLLLLENKRAGNYLRVLHPGNAVCEILPSWIGDEIGSLAYHPEEDPNDGESVLQQIYGKLFQYKKGEGLYQVRELSPFESLYGLEERHKVILWPEDDRNLRATGAEDEAGIRQIGKPRPKNEFMPFTDWEVGPFRNTGLVLLSFGISFDEKNFDTLVGDREYFSVDGPQRLRSRIKHDCIPMMPVAEREPWEQRLAFFDTSVDFERTYDIIVRTAEEADGTRVEIDQDGSCMIAKATDDRQSKDVAVARRYVTMDSDFKLNLHFVGRGSSQGEPAQGLIDSTPVNLR